jgi:hypothetical protein
MDVGIHGVGKPSDEFRQGRLGGNGDTDLFEFLDEIRLSGTER